MKCKCCNLERMEGSFYLKLNGKKYADECKNCIAKRYDYKILTTEIETGFEDLLRKMDVPYIANVYSSCNSIGEYMKTIHMPQYKEKRFKDSVFYKLYTVGIEELEGRCEDKCESADLIIVLNNEINCLVNKITKVREDENWGTYKNLINALRDVVNLRNEELSNDYKLMYSEYRTEVAKDIFQKQIAVWEQNSKGEIRNHKVWNIEEKSGCLKGNNVNGDIKVTLDIENKEEIESVFKEFQDKLNNIKIGLNL